MQKIFLFTVLLIFCLLYGFSFNSEPGQILFRGHTKGRVDSIKVRFCPDFLYNNLGGQYFKVSIDDNGYFTFTIDKLDHMAKMDFEIYGEQISVLYNFVSEPGDSIFFFIDNRSGKPTYSFEGRGAPKYQCVLAIDEQQMEERQSAESTIQNQKSAEYVDFADPKNAGWMFSFYKNRISSKEKILTRFHRKMSPDVRMLIEADFRGYYQTCWEGQLRLFYYLAKDGVPKEKAIQIAHRYDIPVDSSNQYIKSLSLYYTMFLIQKSNNKIYFEKYNYSFHDMYNQIRSDYAGLLREKALMLCLLDPLNRKDSDMEEYDSCLADAYRLISTSYIREAIGYELSVFKKGTDVYDFSFPDTAGKHISRFDLKGKIVLVDVWGTGCSGCITFARNFDLYVQPMIPADSPFVYLSINSDADKNKWMSSLRKGIYSPKHCIDVYTDGFGDDHPMLQFYRVEYNPFLFLMDKKGKILVKIAPSSKPEDLAIIILNALNVNQDVTEN